MSSQRIPTGLWWREAVFKDSDYLAKLSTYPRPMKKFRAGSVGSSASYMDEKEEGNEPEAICI